MPSSVSPVRPLLNGIGAWVPRSGRCRVRRRIDRFLRAHGPDGNQRLSPSRLAPERHTGQRDDVRVGKARFRHRGAASRPAGAPPPLHGIPSARRHRHGQAWRRVHRGFRGRCIRRCGGQRHSTRRRNAPVRCGGRRRCHPVCGRPGLLPRRPGEFRRPSRLAGTAATTRVLVATATTHRRGRHTTQPTGAGTGRRTSGVPDAARHVGKRRTRVRSRQPRLRRGARRRRSRHVRRGCRRLRPTGTGPTGRRGWHGRGQWLERAQWSGPSGIPGRGNHPMAGTRCPDGRGFSDAWESRGGPFRWRWRRGCLR